MSYGGCESRRIDACLCKQVVTLEKRSAGQRSEDTCSTYARSVSPGGKRETRRRDWASIWSSESCTDGKSGRERCEVRLFEAVSSDERSALEAMRVHVTGMASVFRLPAPSLPSASPVPDAAYDVCRTTPIVIDNGASCFRWGFASADSPYVAINAVAKYKERKSNKLLLLFGDTIDAENGAKGQARTPWEGDVLLNFDALVRGLLSHPSGHEHGPKH